jgi:Histidine kinase-, DNA gyrase B-, and HSP90-like ATPase
MAAPMEWRVKMNTMENVVDMNELEKQTAYAESLENAGFDYGLAVGSAFAESMRNTYYKHTGTALDEINDNGIEAGAGEIHTVLAYYGKSEAKPDAIATIDNAHGMGPRMLRLSVLWGGTHREGSRTGFGRFGFGLPSASVNQCRRFTVFSIVEGGDWHSVVVDLDDVRDGKYTRAGKIVIPPANAEHPPKWVMDYIKANFPEGHLKHGTVVLWEKIDRLKWKTTAAMTKNLLEHFGTTYRNYLAKVKLVFNGTRVEPLDPLFITPGFRHYDLDKTGLSLCRLPNSKCHRGLPAKRFSCAFVMRTSRQRSSQSTRLKKRGAAMRMRDSRSRMTIVE